MVPHHTLTHAFEEFFFPHTGLISVCVQLRRVRVCRTLHSCVNACSELYMPEYTHL